jgi:hypothetical protein
VLYDVTLSGIRSNSWNNQTILLDDEKNHEALVFHDMAMPGIGYGSLYTFQADPDCFPLWVPGRPRPCMVAATEKPAVVSDQEQYIAESKDMRLKHLEEQAMFALKSAVENYGNAVFPNAMIAGDVVITDLLWRSRPIFW